MMKKWFFSVVILFFGVVALYGQEDCMVGFWFGSPKVYQPTVVNSMRLGLPGSSGGPVTVNGMELSIFCSSSEILNGFQWILCGAALAGRIRGVQLALFNRVQRNIDGVQIGLVNESNENAGVQIGLVNYVNKNAAFQLGLLNVNPDGFLPFSILINFGGTAGAN